MQLFNDKKVLAWQNNYEQFRYLYVGNIIYTPNQKTENI